MLLTLRSILFNIAYYTNLILWMLAILPALAMPRPVIVRAVKAWARSSLWLLRVIAGTGFELRGRENIPSGGFLVAAKHQSLWETFALLVVLEDPVFIMKRELMWIPFFGWYAWKASSVPIDRKGGSTALAAMNQRAAQEIARGRQIVIFPEGTRRPPGAEPRYKYGIAHLYSRLNVPCLPIALNSGLFWPRRKVVRRPGTIVVSCLPVIEAGLPREAFFRVVQERIEGEADALDREARAELAGYGILMPAPATAASLPAMPSQSASGMSSSDFSG